VSVVEPRRQKPRHYSQRLTEHNMATKELRVGRMHASEPESVDQKNEDKSEHTYTLEEVEIHSKPGDYWTVIGENVYDITQWVEGGKHPGGDLILQGVGRDASVLFETSHPLYVKEKILKKYYVGKVKRPESAFKYQWDSAFYRTLKERVETYFKDNKLSYQDAPLLWIQGLHTIFFFFLFWYFAFVQGNLLACIPCGWFYSQFGISIMHDGNHGAYSKSRLVCRIAGLVMDFMGASSLVWKHEHNIGHHQFTNSAQDPDSTTAFPILRYNPSQPWKPHHAYQHYYVWLLYPFICVKWYLSDITFVLQGTYRGIPMYTPSRAELVLLCVTKITAPLFFMGVPWYYHGFLNMLLLLNLCLMTASYCFALQFVVTHLADDVIFPEEYQLEPDWAKCQVMSSSNYSSGSALVTWLSGGLNYQIEHHLFPTISHVHLPRIAPIVKKTCEEFGVPYFVHDCFWTALTHHYAHLKRMAQPPAKAVPYHYPLTLSNNHQTKKQQ
jgi:fatty acid desaturase